MTPEANTFAFQAYIDDKEREYKRELTFTEIKRLSQHFNAYRSSCVKYLKDKGLLNIPGIEFD